MNRNRSIKHPQRGIFEKLPGSGIWWIRYTDGSGAYKREKVGNWSAAKALYEKRKTDARLGVKMPENLRHRGVTFGALADAAIQYSETHHKDTRNVAQRIKASERCVWNAIGRRNQTIRNRWMVICEDGCSCHG